MASVPAKLEQPDDDDRNQAQIPVVSGDQFAAIYRAEIDAKTRLARQYPRSETKAIDRVRTLVKLDKEVAASCTYSLPKRRGSDEPITGASIRFAELLMYSWGNLDVRTRIVGDDGLYVKVQVVGTDLENGGTLGFEVTRPIVDRYGRRYSPDMVKQTAAAATSIGIRDCILKLVPKPLWNPVYKESQKVAIGGERAFGEEVERYLTKIESKGVSRDRVFAALEVDGKEEMTYEHLSWLNNLGKSIAEGGTTLEEAFPEIVKEGPNGGNGGETKADKLSEKIARRRNGGKKQAKPAPEKKPDQTTEQAPEAPEQESKETA
jgi:hypothetical protein